MDIVIDTNVVISGLFFKGKPLVLLEKIISGDIKCFATKKIIEEYTYVFNRIVCNKKVKYNSNNQSLSIFVSMLNIVSDTNTIHKSRDKDDDKFLECAINAKAIYIVSGDNDLLDLKEYEGIKIVKVDDFLKIIENI